jgi:hypothetical protein
MMPAEKTYYTYSGSLTTPPCSEGVRWLLLTTPIELSAEQIEAVGMLFEHNARPIQSLNARDVLQDTSHPSVIQFILANLPHVRWRMGFSIPPPPSHAVRFPSVLTCRTGECGCILQTVNSVAFSPRCFGVLHSLLIEIRKWFETYDFPL